jgi:hypothetical protein
MPLKDVELDVATVLQAASIGSMSASPPTLYAGPFPNTAPDAMVAVAELSDPGEDLEQLGGGGRLALVHELTVQVRGPRSLFAPAKAKAVAAWEALREVTPADYVWWRPTGKPVNLGQDDMGRWRFSFTLRVEYRATATAGTVTPDS